MVKEIDGCLAIAYPLTEGIVKTIKLYEERELSLAWVLCRMEP